MNRVDNKVAFVTGGGSGIGKACCELLAEAGAKIVVSDINRASAEETAKSIIAVGGEAIAVDHDISNEAAWERVMASTLEQFQKLDVLVNCAGICLPVSLKNTTLEAWRQTINVNLDGTFLGIRSAITAMTKNQDPGSIINIASVSGHFGANCQSSYCASKGGVRLLSKSAATECGKKGYNIRVNTISPGSIETPINKGWYETPDGKKLKAGIPMGRWGQAMDIAKGVLFLASDDSSFITGIDLVIDGGVMGSFGSTGMILDDGE